MEVQIVSSAHAACYAHMVYTWLIRISCTIKTQSIHLHILKRVSIPAAPLNSIWRLSVNWLHAAGWAPCMHDYILDPIPLWAALWCKLVQRYGIIYIISIRIPACACMHQHHATWYITECSKSMLHACMPMHDAGSMYMHICICHLQPFTRDIPKELSVIYKGKYMVFVPSSTDARMRYICMHALTRGGDKNLTAVLRPLSLEMRYRTLISAIACVGGCVRSTDSENFNAC